MELFIILFIGALIGSLSTLFCLSILIFISPQIAKGVIYNIPIDSIINTPEIQQDLSIIIDQKLETVMNSIKGQVPMSGLFLSDSLTGKFKKQAEEELLNSLPQIAKKMIPPLAARAEETLTFSNVWKYLKPQIFLLLFIAAAIGAFLNFLMHW